MKTNKIENVKHSEYHLDIPIYLYTEILMLFKFLIILTMFMFQSKNSKIEIIDFLSKFFYYLENKLVNNLSFFLEAMKIFLIILEKYNSFLQLNANHHKTVSIIK